MSRNPGAGNLISTVSKGQAMQTRGEDCRHSFRAIADAVNEAVAQLMERDDPDRDDLRQIACEAVVRGLSRGQFRGECSLQRWVNVIVRNIVNNLLRSRIRTRRLFTTTVDGTDREILDRGRSQRLSEACHDLESIDSILATMDPLAARVIYLHDALGYELTELAPMLGLSIGAAQSRLVRTRKRIVDTLAAGSARARRRVGSQL